MHDFRLTTPVTLIVFNRPDTTARVFDAIRQAKPPQLLIIADGPRSNFPEDVEKCAAVRAIIEQVDWECEVLKNYTDVNLGCKQRVSSGLAWVFSVVEEAIILEDDCLPHPTFFRFCQELLERYRNDERIMHISGDNFQFGQQRTNYSYYFSHYNHVWGWASWRRAWQYYDLDMKLWQEIRDTNWICDIVGTKSEKRFWSKIFELLSKHQINTWDYQWTFACWLQAGMSIVPNVNLVANIGFGDQATHTKSNSKVANLLTQEIAFPLHHPPFVILDKGADERTRKLFFTEPSLLTRSKSKATKLWKAIREK